MDWFSWRIAVAFVRDTLALPTAPPLTVVDVGSREVRTRWRWLGVPAGHRRLFRSCDRVIGVDAEAGPGVDVIADVTVEVPLPADSADVLLSSSMLEHCLRPETAARAMGPLLRPGGWALWVAPWVYPLHSYPHDYWRVMPSGMCRLLEVAGLSVIRVNRHGPYTYGIARRP